MRRPSGSRRNPGSAAVGGESEIERRNQRPGAPGVEPGRVYAARRPGFVPASAPGRRAADERSRRHPDSRRPSESRRRSGYSEIERSQNQRLGAPNGELRRESAPPAGRVRPGAGITSGSGEGTLAPLAVPTIFPATLPVASLSGKRAGSRGVRAETATETTIRDGRRRTRTLSRFARRPGSVPASVPGRRTPTIDRAVLPGSPDHSKGAAVVGIPRSNSRRINDLEREMANSGAVPPRSPARGHPGAGITSGSGEVTLAPLASRRSSPRPFRSRRSPGSAAGRGVFEWKPPRRPRFAMADGEPGRCSAFARRSGSVPASVPGFRTRPKDRAVFPVHGIIRGALP